MSRRQGRLAGAVTRWLVRRSAAVYRDGLAHPNRRLDPARFVLEYPDHRSLRDIGRRPGVVQRHYVTPIRWKFWVVAFGGFPRWLAALAVPRWGRRLSRRAS